MRPAVAAVAVKFMARFEGYCPWMYLDIRGLVTTGRGDLIDPVAPALVLPWTHLDGTPANTDDVQNEWRAVKAMQERRKAGGGAFATLTKLRLTKETIDAMDAAKLARFELVLRTYFPGWDAWPADAQLATLSMAWAAGPAFSPGFPHFTAAVNAGQWDVAAGPEGDADTDIAVRGEAWLRDGTPGQATANENPGLRPRNLANRALFRAAVMTTDPTRLQGATV